MATADFRNTMQEWDYRHLAKYSVDMARKKEKIKILPLKIFERFSNTNKLKASLMFWHWTEIDISKGKLRRSSGK